MEKPRHPLFTAPAAPLPAQAFAAVPASRPHKVLLEEIRRQLGWSLITAARR